MEESRLEAAEACLELEIELGHHHQVIPELLALVAEHPFRERVRAQLMLAQYRAGRRADALRTYQETRRYLRDQIGLEPGPALRHLHERILRDESGLMRQPAHRAGMVVPSQLPPRVLPFVGRGRNWPRWTRCLRPDPEVALARHDRAERPGRHRQDRAGAAVGARPGRLVPRRSPVRRPGGDRARRRAGTVPARARRAPRRHPRRPRREGRAVPQLDGPPPDGRGAGPGRGRRPGAAAAARRRELPGDRDQHRPARRAGGPAGRAPRVRPAARHRGRQGTGRSAGRPGRGAGRDGSAGALLRQSAAVADGGRPDPLPGRSSVTVPVTTGSG